MRHWWSRHYDGAVDRPRYDEVVQMKFLTRAALNLSDVLYEVTDLGRQVAEIQLHPDFIRPSCTN